jgi:hypothetical protein
MAMQSLFARAVSTNLSTVIPTALEGIDQFAIGKVLTYQKKPRKLLPWRRHELNFTGRSITDLVAEGQLQELSFTTSSDFLFDAGKGTDKISVEFGLDGELRAVLSKLDLKLHAMEEKNMSISTDFGKITHVQTDLFEVLYAHRIKVNTDHPVIREARKNGNTLFVISTLYEAERCNIEVVFSEKTDDAASATAEASTASVPLVGGGAGGGVDDSKSFMKVVNRDRSTAIGYLLLRLVINENGELIPKLNNRLDQTSDPTRVDMIDAPEEHPDGGASSKLTVPKINPADSVVGEWVMVDMVREWKPEDSMEASKKFEEKTADTQGTQTSTTAHDISVTHPSVTASLAVPSLNQHYIYSLKDFQCFASNTYEGAIAESRGWVRPVQANQPLKEALLAYIKPPNSHQKLRTLSEYLQDSGTALRTVGIAPPNVLPALDPIVTAMSTEKDRRLNENTSLIVIAEACLEFPQDVMQMIIELQSDKRELLLDVIKHTPKGVGRHVFLDDKPFHDPALYPVMRLMGFSVPERRLVYTCPDDVEDDVLAAGIIVILFSS